MKKGISLIVLIVTIIVMIIIAGAIIISLSNTNVIDQAENAVANHNNSTEKEMLILAYSDYMVAKLDNVNATLQVEGATVTGDAINGWNVEFENGNKYVVSSQGEIIKDKAIVYDPEGWKYAWTSDGVTWSNIIKKEELESGTTVEGKIIAKIYETDETIEKFETEGMTLSEGKGYVLSIEGTGEMPIVTIEDGGGYFAWWNTLYKYYMGEEEDPIIPYITKVIIGEGITNIPECMIFESGINLKEIIIANSVTKIGEYAFARTNIESIVIPGSVKQIGVGAFDGCEKLHTVILENGVEKIDSSAFYGCTNLSKVKLSETLKQIEIYAFEYCISLETIVIPKSVEEVSGRTFSSCKKMKDIYIEATSSNFGVGSYAFNGIADNSIIYVRNENIANNLKGAYNTDTTTISTDYNWVAPTN